MTQPMTRRERVLAALAHREPDRIPVDIGGTKNSTIHLVAYERLRHYLGLSSEVRPRLCDRMMQVVDVDEDILQMLDIDTRAIYGGSPDRPRGYEVDIHTYVDEWGVTRRKLPGMHYAELISSPLAGEISISDIVRYPWPNPLDPGLTRPVLPRIEQLRETTDCALTLHLPSAFVHKSQYLLGFESWFLNMALDSALMGALFDAILELSMAEAGELLCTAGHLVDVVVIADDLADQNGPIVSLPMYHRLIAPRHRRYMEFIRDRTAAPILFHSCGAVGDLLHDLADMGINAVNPVQVSARGMDSALLKREFGDRLAFWGAIDTQYILPRGSKEEVQIEVRRRIADLAPGGGYILSAVHNIQPDVPPENICAMVTAARNAMVHDTRTYTNTSSADGE